MGNMIWGAASAGPFNGIHPLHYLAGNVLEAGPMEKLRGHSITYLVAIDPQQGRKVFTLQTLPASGLDEQFDSVEGNVAGFSLHAGVAAKIHQRKKLERLCRYIA